MPIYLWPNDDTVTIVEAKNRQDAVMILDELDGVDAKELIVHSDPRSPLLLTVKISKKGNLTLGQTGEGFQNALTELVASPAEK